MQQKKLVEKLYSMGFNLMPLKPQSKYPIGEKWQRLQSEKYTGEFPEDCNIAVICGTISNNLFVLDLDDMSLYDEFKDFKTFKVKTARGVHLYFRSSGFVPNNRKFDDQRGRHIDCKSEGGYVLAPGSIHPDTKREYEIIDDSPVAIIDPNILKDKLEKLGFNVQKLSMDEIKKGVKEGGRNDSMFKLACYLMREGLYDKALESEMNRVNQLNTPPLPENELKILVQQAYKYEGHRIQPAKEIVALEELKKNPEQAEKYIGVLGKETIEAVTGKPFGIQQVTLQDIKASIHEGMEIQFDASIMACAERLTYISEASFVCKNCDDIKDIECDEFRELPKVYCKDCKRYMDIMKSGQKTDFVQQLRLQEFLELARNNSPIEYEAEIYGDDVGEAFMGQRKRFTAIFTSRRVKDENRNVPVLQITKMEDLQQNTTCMPSEEELERWKADSDIYNKVCKSIAPELHLNPKIRETGLLFVVGGTSLNGKRELIHVGNYGDAQTGKSEFERFLHKMTPGSAMVVGSGATGAGLTVGMVKMYNGQMIPRAGTLAAHTGHPVYIDEIDKMKKEHLETTYESMEQGTVTLHKAGFPDTQYPANCPIMDSGNPKGGKMNSKRENVMDNFDFPTPFVTRHDIIWLWVDKNDPELDEVIMNCINDYESNRSNYMTMEELQRFYCYAKTIRAKVPEKLQESIKDIYRKIRPLNKQDALPIGLRQYYGLYRLVTASAAAHLRDIVTDEDIKIVYEIIKESLKSLGMDIETHKVEQPFKKKKDTKEDVFLTVWSECIDVEHSVDRDEFIEKLGERLPFNPISAAGEFEKYKRANRIELQNSNKRYLMKHG